MYICLSNVKWLFICTTFDCDIYAWFTPCSFLKYISLCVRTVNLFTVFCLYKCAHDEHPIILIYVLLGTAFNNACMESSCLILVSMCGCVEQQAPLTALSKLPNHLGYIPSWRVIYPRRRSHTPSKAIELRCICWRCCQSYSFSSHPFFMYVCNIITLRSVCLAIQYI